MKKYRRVNEDILPDEVYNKAWGNAKRTYVVTARDAAPYHYEINTEYGIYAKVPNDTGFLAHWFLDTRSRDTVEEMEELASKYIRKYNCKKVSVQEYKKIVDGGVKESYRRRIRESINSECYEEDLETLIDVFPVYGFHRHDFSLLVPRKQKELINTIRKRFEVPEGISIRDYVYTEIDDTRPVDDVIRDGIRDDFDYLESICDGDITPELKNLSYLNYGEDIVSEL